MSIIKWANSRRYLSTIEAGRAGKYRIDVTPYLAWPNGPLDAIDDPNTNLIVCQKSAQVAWTSGVLGNAIGKWIDVDPSPILVLFPKESAAKDYMLEKFTPMVDATPALRAKINLRSRAAQQTQLRKWFAGGFIKLVGSNSPASVKSTPSPRVLVEEPDDCNINLRNQGDSIALAKERTKTYARSRVKVIIGGTPTVEGVSAIAAEMQITDQRVGMIPCHACGEAHVLNFENLRWDTDDSLAHPVYGNAVLGSAHYRCPLCEERWTDAQKNRNVRRGWWQATAPFTGAAGYYLNELYSPFPGSVMAELLKKKLVAEAEFARGDPGPMIAFVNSSVGLPYRYRGDVAEPDELAEKALDYLRGTVPVGGLILTVGVDVQHTWLEVVIRAWGRGEESWLVLHDRIDGNPKLIDDPCWAELDKLLLATYRSDRGYDLSVSAVSIDSSDGSTNDAVYAFVRARSGRSQMIMAIKGATSDDAEIFSRPSAPKDHKDKRGTKASKFGLRVYMVGTGRAKDVLIGENGRVKLSGTGPQTWHAYRDNLAADFFQQLVSEVKVPIRTKNGSVVKRWSRKVGVRNEVLDCEVYALHASRALRVDKMQPKAWDAFEAQLAQASLFESEPEPEVNTANHHDWSHSDDPWNQHTSLM